MRISAHLTGIDAPARLARRLEREAGPEARVPPRLEGRFKDRRGFTVGAAGPGFETGDLKPAPRPAPSRGRR